MENQTNISKTIVQHQAGFNQGYNMSKETYFNITENAKNYPLQPWTDSDHVACFGVPCDEGINIMPMYEAMAFVASNDISSMIALKIPKAEYDLMQAQEDETYTLEMKDEYYLDYKGVSLI